MKPGFWRAAAALLLVSAWMGLLMTGGLPASRLHLLLAASLILFPWRQLRDDPPDHRLR